MKRIFILLCIAPVFFACGDGKQVPDVSNIKIDLSVHRFEQDFFALDSNRLADGLSRLKTNYPVFFDDFRGNILGLPPLTDSSTAVLDALRQFLRDYRPIYDSSALHYANMDPYVKEIRQGLQLLKHYFPDYQAPKKIYTFIGPMDAIFAASTASYGDAIASDGMAIGLQLHLGKDFSFYHSPMGQALYPNYISRRFSADYIAVNCLKNAIDDLYPLKRGTRPLIDEMVEKGKRLYLLDKIMPYTADTLKIGYTGEQLDGCFANEGRIWNFFITNGFLLQNDPALQQSYLGEGPETQELGKGAPGYIGLFVGWQIVKKYMKEHPEIGLPQLLQTASRKIYEDSKYRPR